MSTCLFNVLHFFWFFFFLLKGRKKGSGGNIRTAPFHLSWRGLIDSSWQAKCQCCTVGNKIQRKGACAEAYMSWADSVLLVILKCKDHTSSNQTEVTFAGMVSYRLQPSR